MLHLVPVHPLLQRHDPSFKHLLLSFAHLHFSLVKKKRKEKKREIYINKYTVRTSLIRYHLSTSVSQKKKGLLETNCKYFLVDLSGVCFRQIQLFLKMFEKQSEKSFKLKCYKDCANIYRRKCEINATPGWIVLIFNFQQYITIHNEIKTIQKRYIYKLRKKSK